MAEFDKAYLLDELERRHRNFMCDVETLTSTFDQQQWQWKPSSTEWSFTEILEHLLLTHGDYADAIDFALVGSIKANEQVVYSSWFGRSLDALMRPKEGQISRKIHAPKRLRPSNVRTGQEELSAVHSLEERFLKQIERARQLKITDLKVSFALIKLLKVPIVDVWRFIASHNERHLLQMQNVKIRMQVRE